MSNEARGKEFKWFGEGFDGFPKHLPENCIEYSIYVINKNIKAKQRLRQVEQEAVKLSKSLLKDYIWQREAFSLQLKSEDGNVYLRGRTNFGDSIVDEWTIVYILRKLSFDFHDVWIRVYDNDGEFLLIEAANALPKWLNPEVAENRVWLNRGKLFIIPTTSADGKSMTKKGPLSLENAQKFIALGSSKLINSPAIENEAFHRIKDYPDAMRGNFHTALLRIPRKLAYIIHKLPMSISPAIEAFYLRDPISLKHLDKKNVGELRFPPVDLVTVSVRFTKVGYAQIRNQDFNPPVAWARKVVEAVEELDLQEVTQVDTGVKITCGYEMLLADSHYQDFKAVREISLLLEDLESGEENIPTDKVISEWSQAQDNEKWLDIDFNAFDRELSGQAADDNGKSGFGDEAAQDSLRKIVERFEAFLKDDGAGLDDVNHLEDMDFDNDDESSDEGSDVISDNSSLHHESSNPKSKYAALSDGQRSGPLQGPRVQELDSDDDDEVQNQADEEGIIREMQQMEEELRGYGALDLDPRSGNPATIEEVTDERRNGERKKASASTSEGTDRAQLAKQLLESFKAQAGAPGPAGNLMSMLDIQLPRDEGQPED